jgi:hypothetical protein
MWTSVGFWRQSIIVRCSVSLNANLPTEKILLVKSCIKVRAIGKAKPSQGKSIEFDSFPEISASSLLSEVYLDCILDLWVEDRKATARGEMNFFRFADDIVECFQYKDGANRFHEQLKKRLASFDLPCILKNPGSKSLRGML